MSTEKKVPPIQPSLVKPFTLRLVNGHFVRVPKVEHLAVTDATRPSAVSRQEFSPHGDGVVLGRGLRLVNGHFVNGPAPAPVQIPPMPGSAADSLAPAAPNPKPPSEPSPDSWAYAFRTKLDPSDSPPKT